MPRTRAGQVVNYNIITGFKPNVSLAYRSSKWRKLRLQIEEARKNEWIGVNIGTINDENERLRQVNCVTAAAYSAGIVFELSKLGQKIRTMTQKVTEGQPVNGANINDTIIWIQKADLPA